MQHELGRMLDDYDRGRLSRRQLVAHMSGLAAVLATFGTVRAQDAPGTDKAAPAKPTFDATDVNHIALTVTDLDRSRAFYQRHLGLEVAGQSRWNCFLRCQEHNFLALFKGEKPGLNHYCFSVKEYDAADAVKRLKATGLDAKRREDRVYFDDPDGLEVQVASKTHSV